MKPSENTSSNNKKNDGRLLELDVLRGLAALSVLCFHYTSRYTELYAPAVPALFQFPYGSYGVDLFFMISGFVIFMTLEKTREPWDFVVSRFSRLYPAYWAALILTFTVILIFRLPGRETSLHDGLINISMMEDWFGAQYVDGVYWTLTIELSFYVLMFVLLVTQRLKDIEILGIAWLIIMIYDNKFINLMHPYVPGWFRPSKLLNYGNLFFAGILFYNLKTKGNAWWRHAAIALCLLVQYMFRTDIQGPLIVASFFLFFYLFIYGRLAWLVNQPLLYLGTISYSLYLVHQNIGYVIMRHLDGMGANACLRFFVPALCALGLASAITFGIERPAMRFIRQRFLLTKKKGNV